MGNPHAQEVELAYLAGVIDGEGTITIERTGNRRLNGIQGLSPKVVVANTDTALIDYCANLFKRIGVKPHIKMQKRGYKTRKKDQYWITIGTLTKCRKLLIPIMPFLIAKHAQAELVMEFIRIRGDTLEAKGKPYGQAELRLLERIRALNIRGATETEDYDLTRLRRQVSDSPGLRENVRKY